MAIIDRISSLDNGYVTGDLSVYPAGLDSYDTLYQATNNAQTFLTQSLNYTGKFFVVDDTSSFPSSGLVKIGTEIIYYGSKTKTVFKDIIRGFVRSQQRSWLMGTKVMGSVMAEHHNALKDAIINTENNLGVKTPPAASLNGILTGLEHKFLAPKSLFRGVPIKGPLPLSVRFQNFSDSPAVRFLWDFGDGSTSLEASPTHTYLATGHYTVTLNTITSLGATGITTKSEYIIVDIEEDQPFFYIHPTVGTTSTVFTFIDQSKGAITNRYWIWDDGNKTTITDPDIHTATHQYNIAGQYQPTLLLNYADGTLKKVGLDDFLVVTE